MYAILNKIDTIWDELEDQEHNRRTLDKIRGQCARHLAIAPDEILCVSAKEGLLAQIDGDIDRLDASCLPELEDLLSHDMMRRKEHLIQKSVINHIHGMLHSSKKALLRRKQSVKLEIKALRSDESSRKNQLQQLLEQARQEQNFYHKKLILLKSSRKTILREGTTMLEPINGAKLERYLKNAGKALSTRWTIVGMNNAIDSFFNHLKADMTAAAKHQEKLQLLVADIYARYEAEQSMAPLDYPRFSPRDYITRLEDLRTKAGSFRRNLRKLLTEQKATSKRFLGTIVREASSIYRQYEKDARDWLNDVLLPLFQNAQEQKQLLDDHVIKLRNLQHAEGDLEQRLEQMETLLQELDEQIKDMEGMLQGIRKPAPIQRNRNAIPTITAVLTPRNL